MFPVSDVIPSRTTPCVTIALVGITIVVFGFELTLDAEELERLIRRHGVRPGDFSAQSAVTSLFLHAGWVHLAGNMLYLWIFGDNVEDCLGHVRYLVFYLLCGGVAALGQVVIGPHSQAPVIGASSAVSGVMGAYFVLFPRSRVLTAVLIVFYLDLIEIPAIYFLGIWFVLQLFSGIGSIGAEAAYGGTAFWAHLVGFGVGATVGGILRLSKRPEQAWSDRGRS